MAAPARPLSSPPEQHKEAAGPHLVAHPSASASPPPSSPLPAPVEFRSAHGDSRVHEAMSLLLRNEFDACKALTAEHGLRGGDLKCLLVSAYLRAIEAISTYGEGDLKDAIALCWDIEKKASKTKTIEGQLLQADTHFLGALMQIIQQSFVKAALNLRRSWNHFEAAQKKLDSYEGPDAEDLRGWAAYGNGFYQLVMSLLPPTVMRVAGWVGFSGNRDAGLALLRRSQQSSSFMAPLSCLILITYLVNIGSLTGEADEQILPQCDELLAWGEARFPQGVLFLIMRSRLARCRRNLVDAIAQAKQAVRNCRELPSVATLLHFHTGFSALFLLDWQLSAHYFDCMLHATPGGAYTPPPGQPKVLPEEQRILAEEEAEGGMVRMPPARSSALTFYACLCGINYMLLGAPHKARWYCAQVQALGDPSSKKPLDIYARRKSADILARQWGDPPEDALLDAAELILTWNGAHQMPEQALRRMITLLDAAAAKQLPHWTPTHRAAIHLYKADMLKGLGDVPAALEQVRLTLAYLPDLRSSAKAKADGTLAFAHYTAAFLLVADGQIAEGSAQLKLAQGISGYDQYNPMQIRMHALEARIKREKNKPQEAQAAAAAPR